MADLWPDDISEARITSPVRLLREQAALLGQKTGNAVEAKVNRTEEVPYWADSGDFIYRFYIVAPTLVYRFELFQIAFPVEMYPLVIKPDDDVVVELRKLNSGYEIDPYGRIKLDSDEKLLPLLASILGSAKTRKIVQSLLAQVRET